MTGPLPDSHARSLGHSLSRRLLAAVTVASVLVGAAGCRTTDEQRLVNTSVTVVRSVEGSTVVERVPGGRPGGRGDPRRYSDSTQHPGSADPSGT